jgi:hypothetical protein
VLFIRGCRLVQRAFARILDTQERDDRKRLIHAARASGFHQHSRQARIDRQRRHLAPEPRNPPLAIDCPQFQQQAVPIVQQARIGRIEERKFLRIAEL